MTTAGLAVFVALMLSVAALAQSDHQTVSIQSNFNGTAIPAGSYVWFNSQLTPSNIDPNGGNIFVSNASLNIAGTVYPLPNAIISYEPNPPAPSLPSTTYDAGSNTWITRIPGPPQASFMTGYPIQFPVGLAGGQNPVTFTATFSTSFLHVSGSFQWAAAVYTQMPSDLNQLGVQVVEGQFHAGTPVNYRQFVIGGARGGGGSDFTGSSSATGHFDIVQGGFQTPTPTPTVTPNSTPTPPFVTPTPPVPTPEPGTIVLFGTGLLGLGSAAARLFFGGRKKGIETDDQTGE
jgi:hypothetical protein